MSPSKISNKDFVHCHAHSEYSQYDGLIKVRELAMTAREMGFPALSLTDHGAIGGLIKFIEYCGATEDKQGKEIPYPPIKPILGCEMYVSRRHTYNSKAQQKDGRKGNRHLVILAKNWKGYQNLCRLSQKSWLEGFYIAPRIDFEQLSEHSEGLIVNSACLSSIINANLLHDKYKQARDAAYVLKCIFKEDFFLEVMYHGIDAQRVIIADIFKLGKELDIPIIATNDVHYLKRPHSLSHEVMMCMLPGSSQCIANPDRKVFPYPELYLKSAEEMLKVFSFAPQVISNTVALAERIDAQEIEDNLFNQSMRQRAFIVPEGFDGPYDYLCYLAYEGLRKLRWDQSPKHVEALKTELNDIKIAYDNNGYDFASYFLIVWDYVDYAVRNGILTGPGRGSGFGSVVLHCLGITYGPDPLEYGLLWERFLAFDDCRYIRPEDFGFKEK